MGLQDYARAGDQLALSDPRNSSVFDPRAGRQLKFFDPAAETSKLWVDGR